MFIETEVKSFIDPVSSWFVHSSTKKNLFWFLFTFFLFFFLLLLLNRFVAFSFSVFNRNIRDFSFKCSFNVTFIKSLICLFVEKSVYCSIVFMLVLSLSLVRSYKEKNHLDVLKSWGSDNKFSIVIDLNFVVSTISDIVSNFIRILFVEGS